MAMAFQSEEQFEEALTKLLASSMGWETEILMYPTEADLIRNWADILFANNRSRDRLGDYPLTQGEMQQIINHITIDCRTPLALNEFINGKSVSIRRENPEDKEHFGKNVSLKIYDRTEIAAGQSRYQIARQPVFHAKSKLLGDRRGDVMLLINGMPVIHIELKRSGIPVSQAYYQIEKYAKEGVFTGLFSLVQVFVAMNPEETVYFANPGPDGTFNKDYYFHWADFNNTPMNDWQAIASHLLSIPMAHQLIGFYTVADHADGVLKVMRSYQYYAASGIAAAMATMRWGEGNQRGGYVWHTTGSGKTMTSFKAAQLIADGNDADKVIFLTDRIELGTQSLKAYRAFAGVLTVIQATEHTRALKSKLRSSNPDDTLVLTSIQKMSNLAEEGGLSAKDRTSIDGKRMVFIVDEAHRSTFGTMLAAIKATFPNAVFFGFTGTPIFEENAKKRSDQMDVFGVRIHTYTIADGIRDGNVLGFDPYQVLTFRDRDVRRAVALHEAKAQTVAEALADPAKAKVYRHFTTDKKIRMAGYADVNGTWVQGIEDYLPSEQYRTEEHTKTVVEDIGENWEMLSHAGKFHAIFATSSIAEAVRYYRRMKAELPKLAVTCLFDPNIDNNDGATAKQNDLLEIISDYNARYAQNFTIPMHAAFKKDVALRLAHKEPYRYLAPEQQLDLLIVVDQMLTGFDSKWVNTLYLDKLLTYENIIQAFSRTNRLFGSEKPFGVIRYYRKPHTMKQNIEAAVRLYAENRPQGLFVDKLPYHLRSMNELYADIADLFAAAGVADFMQLPGDRAERGKFAALFRDFNSCLRAAEVQGFHWKKSVYKCEDGGAAAQTITLSFDEQRYRTLALRYKELFAEVERTRTGGGDVPYDLVGDLMEIDTEVIDADYMNSRFEKYLKALEQGDGAQQAKDELHRTFAALGREEQKYAAVFLHDLESGNVTVEAGRTLRDYITQYQCHAKTTEIDRLADAFGLDGKMLKEILGLGLTAATINAYGRLDALKQTVDLQKAQAFLKDCDGRTLRVPDVHRRVDEVLRTFILNGALAPEIRTALL